MYIIYIFYTKKKHYEYDFEVSSLMGFPWLYYSNFFFKKYTICLILKIRIVLFILKIYDKKILFSQNEYFLKKL